MILERVTITGADNSIAPWRLIRPSMDYQFVEYGLLVSAKQFGQNRFPSKSWLDEYFEVQKEFKMHTSIHMCGKILRDLMLGEDTYTELIGGYMPQVERVQLNFHGGELKYDGQKFIDQLRRHSLSHIEWIFQIEGVNDALYHLAVQEGVKAVPLFDMSHRTGVLPHDWPEPVAPRCGYAGGLGPECLDYQLQRIKKVSGWQCAWVDMETRIRSADDMVFDIEKAKKCLGLATEWTKKPILVWS